MPKKTTVSRGTSGSQTLREQGSLAAEKLSSDPRALLRRSLASNRIHSAYLLSGTGSAPREAALEFVRGLVCSETANAPCESCIACRRSTSREEIAIDGTGRKGPLLRHVGDHADLFWVERGAGDTRVRIGQIRALQNSLRLRGTEGGARAAVIADAEWMNQEAQNALLRVLEEPPPQTTLVLVTTTTAGLLATVRSRCQRILFPRDSTSGLEDPEREKLVTRFDAISAATIPELLDWAAEYRGARAVVVDDVNDLLEVATSWIHARVASGTPDCDVFDHLDAYRVLGKCRKNLAQRNANPQMVAERALLAVRGAASR